MKLTLQLCCALWFSIAVNSLSYADGKYNAARGQLLYSTHCIACHTSQIHWRDQKLVKDWSSLVTQVQRWQNIAGLGWNEDEVNDVAHYLNTMFYEYKDTAQVIDQNKFLYKDK